MTREKKEGSDLFAVNNHNEVKPAHRIAGGVVFGQELDVAPMSRARGRGKAVAESRSPTAKALPRGSSKGKRKTLARQMLDHINAKGNPSRD